jgi:PAS domain S-box-containing protein
MDMLCLLAAGGSGIAGPILLGLAGIFLLCLRTSVPADSPTHSPSPIPADLQATYDAIAAGVIVRRHDGSIAHVNRAACEMVGLAPEGFTAKAEGSVLRFCNEAGDPLAPHDWPSHRALRSGQPVHNQVVGIHAGERDIRWALVNVNLLPDEARGDNRPAAVITFVDITAQKTTTAQLRQAEANLRNMLRAAPMGFGVFHKRRFLWANETLCRLLGHSQDDLLGQDTALLYENNEEFHRVGKSVYRQMLEDGVGSTEARLRRAEGTLFDGHVQVAPLEPGNPGGKVAGTIVDITDLKNAERELRDSVVSLRRKNIALEEITHQIRHERQQLADRIAYDVDRLLLPLVTRLERSLTRNEREYFQAFVDDLHEVLQPYRKGTSQHLASLTATEMRIATLIRRGLTAKEIAQAENLSTATVNTHRANIRKKLDLRGKRVNLATHLRDLFDSAAV